MVSGRPPTSGPRKQTRTRGPRPGPRVWMSARGTKACPLRERALGPMTSQRMWTRRWATWRSA
eukprot:8340900-Alexandrium_andersonii.AAC.1